MKILATWSDDHLPCVGFEHNGLFCELWWTGHDVVGRLELVQDGDISFEVALKKYPELLGVLASADPKNAEGNERDEDEENKDIAAEYSLDGGSLTIYHTEEGYLKKYPDLKGTY